MKLKQLFKGIEGIDVKGGQKSEITGLSSDSRTVAPGNLFIAKKGERVDGTQFIAKALEAGAAAILTDLYDPFLNAVQIIHPAPGKLEALLANRYYQQPSEELFVIGVTGTKGKTTTSYLIRYLLEELAVPTGLIGTIETIVGNHRSSSRLTTLDAIQNQKLLREMVRQGAQAAVLEVSSHGLAQARVEQISFDLALFTNLYSDHLDYHQTIEAYAAEKAKLFQMLNEGAAIINQDSPWAEAMQGGKRRVSFGITSDALIRAENIVLSEKGARFSVSGHPFFVPLMGRFNVYNALGAIAVGLERGAPLAQISEILARFPGVQGRLEAIPNSLGITVFVDYAHNGEALSCVLQTLCEIASARIITVFGCGGNRDAGRRASMGAAAENGSDIVILTTDNPRFEAPEEIVSQVLLGCKHPEKVIQEPDRKRAIEKAVAIAQPGDLVLIAGKGHEKVQICAHQTVAFDDVAIVKEALQNRASSAMLPQSASVC